VATGRAALLAVALAAGITAGIGLAGRQSRQRPDLTEAGLSILAAARYPNRTTSGLILLGSVGGRPERAVGGAAFANDKRASVTLILYTTSRGRRVDRFDVAMAGDPFAWSRDASVCDGELQAAEHEGPLDPRFDKALALLKARC
jgi:hypothetical protein